MTFYLHPNIFYITFVLQLLLMTDVTDIQIVPAVLPIQMGASGVMTRNAFRPTVTAVWLVFRENGDVVNIAASYHSLTRRQALCTLKQILYLKV
jgi:hypothetical protein